MKFIFVFSLLLSVTLLAEGGDNDDSISPSPSAVPSFTLHPVNESANATTEHGASGSSKKMIKPGDQNDDSSNSSIVHNGTNGTNGLIPTVVHYVDFNLTENYNTTSDVYILHDPSLDKSPSKGNDSLIDQGKKMIHSWYSKVTSFTDSMDTEVLHDLWIPFVSGFVAGISLLFLFSCCRLCCRRCGRRSIKMTVSRTKSSRGSKKLQSIDDNRYLLVSNHSDSEGV